MHARYVGILLAVVLVGFSLAFTITNYEYGCTYKVESGDTMSFDDLYNQANAYIDSNPSIEYWKNPSDEDRYTEALNGSDYHGTTREVDWDWEAVNASLKLDNTTKEYGNYSIRVVPDSGATNVLVRLNTSNWNGYPLYNYFFAIFPAHFMNISFNGTGWKLTKVIFYTQYNDRHTTYGGRLIVNVSYNLTSTWEPWEFEFWSPNFSSSKYWLDGNVTYQYTTNGGSTWYTRTVASSDTPYSSGWQGYTQGELIRMELEFVNTTSNPGNFSLDHWYFWQNIRPIKTGNEIILKCPVYVDDGGLLTCKSKTIVFPWVHNTHDNNDNYLDVLGGFQSGDEYNGQYVQGCTFDIAAPTMFLYYLPYFAFTPRQDVKIYNSRFDVPKIPGYPRQYGKVFANPPADYPGSFTIKDSVLTRGTERGAINFAGKNVTIDGLIVSDAYETAVEFDWSLMSDYLSVNNLKIEPYNHVGMEYIAGHGTLNNIDLSLAQGQLIRPYSCPLNITFVNPKLPSGVDFTADKVTVGTYYLGPAAAWDTIYHDGETTFVVRDPFGNLIQGANVSVYASDGSLLASGLTDANGTVSLQYHVSKYQYSPDVYTPITANVTSGTSSGDVVQVYVQNNSIFQINDTVAISMRNATFGGSYTTYVRRYYGKTLKGTVTAIGSDANGEYVNVTQTSTYNNGAYLYDDPVLALTGRGSDTYTTYVTEKYWDYRPIKVVIHAPPWDDYDVVLGTDNVPVTMSLIVRDIQMNVFPSELSWVAGLLAISVMLIFLAYRVGKLHVVNRIKR